MRPTCADAQDSRTGAQWSLEQDASERGVWENKANRMATCRKKNISDALDEVQDETLGLRLLGAMLIEER